MDDKLDENALFFASFSLALLIKVLLIKKSVYFSDFLWGQLKFSVRELSPPFPRILKFFKNENNKAWMRVRKSLNENPLVIYSMEIRRVLPSEMSSLIHIQIFTLWDLTAIKRDELWTRLLKQLWNSLLQNNDKLKSMYCHFYFDL